MEIGVKERGIESRVDERGVQRERERDATITILFFKCDCKLSERYVPYTKYT